MSYLFFVTCLVFGFNIPIYMATIYKEFTVDVSAGDVWSALRDFEAPHLRLAAGFLTDAQLEGDVRTVTFFNGFKVQERLVSLDDANKRLVYTAIGGRSIHHNASFQVFPEGMDRSRVLWITDLLPEEAAVPVGQLVDKGVEAIKQTLRSK